MSRYTVEALTELAMPYLPVRFREGRLPYLFFVVWLLIGVMVVLAAITPYPNGVPAPLAFAIYLFVLQTLYIKGLPVQLSINLGLSGALFQIIYTSWMSGGNSTWILKICW